MRKQSLMDPKVDFAFKQIFAGNTKESKLALIHLLNAILGLQGDNKITDIVYLNPYNDKHYEDDKQSIMDIKVKTGTQELIDIEIQIRNADDYRKRSLYYWSTMYGEQIVEGEAYYNLKKCIVVNIMNFNLLSESGDYHNVFNIIEKNKGFLLLDDLEIHYIELKKLYQKGDINIDSLNTLEQWLLFIKDGGNEEKEDLIKLIRQRNEVIDMAGEILEKVSQDEKARAMYQQRRKWHLDKVSSEKYLLHKGREEGIEEGIKEGIKQGKKQGIEEGKFEELLTTVKILLKKKLKVLSKDIEKQIELASIKQLQDIRDGIFDIESVDDVLKYL